MAKIVPFDAGRESRASDREQLYYVSLACHIMKFDSVAARMREVGMVEPTYEDYCRFFPPPLKPGREPDSPRGGEVVEFPESR